MTVYSSLIQNYCAEKKGEVYPIRNCNPGELPYQKVEDTNQKIQIKPLKETNLGVVRASFDS